VKLGNVHGKGQYTDIYLVMGVRLVVDREDVACAKILEELQNKMSPHSESKNCVLGTGNENTRTRKLYKT
jgi:hypothetical protein